MADPTPGTRPDADPEDDAAAATDTATDTATGTETATDTAAVTASSEPVADAPTAASPRSSPVGDRPVPKDPAAEGADAEERITEIGSLEQIDRLEHPVAVAVGMGVLLVLLLIGVLAFGSSLAGDEDHAEIVQVVLPRMSGRSLAEAQTELERLGLIVDVELDSNEIVPVDVVIDQQPIAGTRIEVGSQVRLRVSDGPAGIDVPDLSGLQGGEAVKLLQTVGLVGAVEDVYDEAVRPGEVVNSSPATGERAAPGSTVTVRVSQGPAPRTVPEVVGRSVGEAVVELARADLTVGEVIERYSPDQAPGTVLETTPAAGEQAPRHQPVDVAIASAELPVTVPDLVGLTSASAARVARDYGLTASVRNQELPAGDTRIGLVISQGQVAGSRVANGTSLTVNVGVLAAPTTTTTAPTTTVPGATTTTRG